MTIVPWDDLTTGRSRIHEEVCLTTGVFDGLHLGHRTLIKKLTSFSGTPSVVSTFTRNPFRFFFPDRYLGDIITLKQKIDLLEGLGIDYLLLIDFSVDFSKLSGKDFFHLLLKHLSLKHVVLGRNHRCGHRGDTGSEDARAMIEPLGTTVDIVDPLVMDGHPVSSTRIREALNRGDVDKAEKLIGRAYSLDLRSLQVSGNGSFLRIERKGIEQIIPPEGRYRCRAGNGRTAVSAVLDIDDRILSLKMEKELAITGIDFLHKDDHKD